MSNWENTFTSWANGPSATEQTKCENAEGAIRKAIAAHADLSGMDISVFPQGSYRNRTNVRQDSDVDICVRLNSTFFPDYPNGKTDKDFGNVDGSITFSNYKNLIHKAVSDYFGEKSVKRGDKAFAIHANTYRIDADVVATFEHRRYNESGSYVIGIGFITDAGKRVLNWPEQTYSNGVTKHSNTGRRYKKMIRILKRLRNVMQEEGVEAAKGVASCLIEALVWNVPDDQFGRDTYAADLRNVLAHAFNQTLNDEACSEWGEVSELKYLFRSTQPWTRQQAHDYVSAAWDYLNFK